MIILLLAALQQPATPATPTRPTLPASPIARLVIQPAEAAVQANDTLRLSVAAYDSSGNGKIDSNESPVVTTSVGRGTAPFIVDQHLYFGTAGDTGSSLQSFGDPDDYNNGIGQVGVRILSWREIR